MSTRTQILALFALPAGVAGYLASGAILSGLALPDAMEGAVLLFVPLLVAGLCMAPFLLPLFDQMARRDLAALQEHRAQAAKTTGSADDPPRTEGT